MVDGAKKRRTPRSWRRLRAALRVGAMPAAVAALSVLLLSGAFAQVAPARAPHFVAWAFLLQAAALAGVRRLRNDPDGPPVPSRWLAEEGALLCLSVLALTQATGGLLSPLYALLYLLGAAFVLAHPLPLALGLLGFALTLDGALFGLSRALPALWPHLAAHAGFTALFAALYHALLAARLRAARSAEGRAVSIRLAEAEQRAREFRLVATSEVAITEPPAEQGRSVLGGVAEVEAAIRGSLEIAGTALGAHTAALFLLGTDEALRLRECVSHSERLFRGPLHAGEGALGAVLASGRAVRLAGDPAALAYYEGTAAVSAFLGVPVASQDGGTALGVLAIDRDAPFGDSEERIALHLGAQIARSIEAERLLAAVRREKDEKARFFRALEELNRTSSVAQAAQAAVEQARLLCPALELCALSLVEDLGDEPSRTRARHRIEAALGEGADVLAGLTFADNPGLVANVVRLGAPLPARAPGEMERIVLFDAATVIKGLRSLKVFPLRTGDRAVGALVCASRSRNALPDAALRELQLLADQAAGALVRARLHDRAEKLATLDGLTGLLNRRSMNTQLEARLRESRRYGRKISFILVDVDHFKRVNDTHGHPAGDAVLKGIAAVLKAQARETDLAARYGGEELALVLPETDAKGALAIAERLRKAIESSGHATEKGVLKVTASLGVSTAFDDADSVEGLIESADAALYRAKQGGRNRVERATRRAAA